MTEYKKIDNLIKQSSKIAVVSHIDPDADNLGSLTALSESLRQLNKKVYPICVDTIPENLKFLYGIEKFKDDVDGKIDLLCILDCSDIKRIGKAENLLQKTDKVVIIDHHRTNKIKADASIVDENATSTGELIYKLIKEINLPLDKNIAESIYTAIVGDTGSFKYESVNSDTFIIAAELLKYDVNKEKINNNLYSKNSISKLKLMSIFLDRIDIDFDKKIAMSYILEEDYKKTKATDNETEGFVEMLRDINDIEIAIFLKEVGDDFKVSLRSKSFYDVSKLSQKFGGGGHLRAAGFTIESKNVNKAFDRILKEI